MREALWNPFLKVGRRGDHHGFALTDGLYNGVCSFRRVVRVSRCLSNHVSSESRVGRSGEEGMAHSFRSDCREDQSVLDQFGLGGGGDAIWCDRRIIMGMWSERVEGSGVSHDLKKGPRAGDAKARSITEGLPTFDRGKRVYTPGV